MSFLFPPARTTDLLRKIFLFKQTFFSKHLHTNLLHHTTIQDTCHTTDEHIATDDLGTPDHFVSVATTEDTALLSVDAELATNRKTYIPTGILLIITLFLLFKEIQTIKNQ